MAVQAQYASNLLIFDRGEQERKEMELSQQQPQQQPGFVDQPPAFANGGVINVNNQRKKGRKSSGAFQMAPTPQMSLFNPSIAPPALINLAQLQQAHHQPPSPLVSTGLRLAFEDNTSSNHDDLTAMVGQQHEEIEQYLISQGEQLRRTLAEGRDGHYRALMATAEQSVARRLREKEIELDRATRLAAELEERIGRLRTESLTWQAKAMADQATAASLHAQIQQAHSRSAAATAADECCGESAAQDAESAHVDPARVERVGRACRVCRVSAISVVVLPCRHLCMCSACDADAARCPLCHAVRAGSVQVFLS